MENIQNVLDNWTLLWVWVMLSLISVLIVINDLRTSNTHIMSIMKLVWVLTVLYSGLIGLLIYWTTGRKQIQADSIWRRGFRSVSHCYSGCGAGEITGIIIAAGILTLDSLPVAIITFSLAFLFGYLLTAFPLIQDGVAIPTAFKDAFTSETASIAVMEIVAIGTDLWLAGSATMSQALFWNSLIVSLSLGLFAAWPVNILLIKWGVKEGMHDPRMVDHNHDSFKNNSHNHGQMAHQH